MISQRRHFFSKNNEDYRTEFYVLRLALRILVCLLPMWCLSKLAFAQDYLQAPGSPTFATTEPIELGFVNLANGNLHLEVPIASFPQRGGSALTYKLVYDSRIWYHYLFTGQVWGINTWAQPLGGWRFATSVDAGTVGASGGPCSGGSVANNFYWAAPDGTFRYFPIQVSNSTSCGSPTGSASAQDASGYFMTVTNGGTVSSVRAPGGAQVYPAFEDTNGNQYSKDSNGNVIDTLGRKPVVITNNCNGNSNQICYDILNSQGGTSRVTLTTMTISVHTAFNRPFTTEYSSTTQKVIQSVQLPDLSSYQFGYDSGTTSGHYGEITSITLPTGGQTSYSYTVNQDANSDMNHWVSQRTFGGSPWTFSLGNVNTTFKTQNVTVTKPSGDYKVYSFSLNNGGWMNSLLFYQVGNSNPLMTVNDTWDVSHPCTAPCTGSGAVYVRKSGETVTMANVTRQTTYSYSGTIDSFPATIKEWNYYSGAPPTNPSRTTTITYLSDTNSAYGPTGKNILNLPSTMVVTDGNGSQLKETDYAYDAAGSLTSMPGIVQHDTAFDSTSVTTRGNRTSVQLWTGGTNYLTTATMTYDTTGQVLTSKDQNNNTTTFDYTDHFADDNGANPPAAHSTTPPGTNAYVTTITLPVSGQLKDYYYYGTGKVAYSSDQNNATTYHHFQDLDDRQTTAYFPIGWALNNYTSATRVDSYLGIQDTSPSPTCSQCRHDQMNSDNLGRVTNSVLVNDPDSQTTVQTDYDSNSRVLDTSHPYRTTSDSTYGFETIAYDGLDRATLVTHQDGTVRKTYFGRNVTAVGGLSIQQCGSCQPGYPTLSRDEAGKVSEVWTDAFGKTVEVDQPAATASTGGTGTSSGTITFTGSEQSTTINECPGAPNPCWITIYDGGVFTINIGGYSPPLTWGSSSTPSSLASTLASTINSDPASPVTASASSNVVTLTSKFNYSLSSAVAIWNNTYFSQPSFSATVSGSALTGNGVAPQMSSPTVTVYTYDPLGTLLKVSVVGGIPCDRTYTYDTLSRMLSATEPEPGNGNGTCPLNPPAHTTYLYYTKSDGTKCSGNPTAVCRRTDGRNITTTYTYDLLNRLTGMTYTDTTPSVSYFYDQTTYNGLTISNGLGRRTGMSDASGATAWSYDANGNVLTEKRTIAGITKAISYVYNKDNSLKQLTYPSSRVVNFTVGNAQRTTAVVDSSGTQYVIAPTSGWMYAPTGALYSAVYGKGAVFTGLTENRTYNNRLQLTGITSSSSAGTALNLGYAYTNGNHSINNSELMSITSSADTGRTQNFLYDDRSQITSALSQAASGSDCWGQTFTIDSVANLTNMNVAQCSATMLSAAVNTYNQFTTGYTYDPAGNMTTDGSYSYVYNAENEITSVNGVSYTYDGNHMRVEKSSGTLYWRAVNGVVIAETDLSGTNVNEYMFFGGRRAVRRDSSGNLYYSQVDHLGTTRSITKVNTSGTASICYDADFTPYGSEMAHANTCAPNYKFTGFERDSETQIDYAMNRYYNPRLGRFMSADPLASTNRYAYALNNPLSLVDPLGLSSCGGNSGSNDCLSDPSSDQPDLAAMTGMRGSRGCDSFCQMQGGDWGTRWFNLNWSPWSYQYKGKVFDTMDDLFAFEVEENFAKKTKDTAKCISTGLQSKFPGSTVTPGASAGEVGGHYNFYVVLGFSSQTTIDTFDNAYDERALHGWPPPARFGSGPALHLENLGYMGDGTLTEVGTAHIDLGNPDAGLGGKAEHVGVDGLWGHIVQFFGGDIDPGTCPWH